MRHGAVSYPGNSGELVNMGFWREIVGSGGAEGFISWANVWETQSILRRFQLCRSDQSTTCYLEILLTSLKALQHVRSNNSTSGDNIFSQFCTIFAPGRDIGCSVQLSFMMVHHAWKHFAELGSPQFVMGSMSDGSDLPFRLLCRPYGVQMAFSPRLYAKHLREDNAYRKQHLQTAPDDITLVGSLCANNVEDLLCACSTMKPYVSTFSLDLSWLSTRAKNGNYGVFILDDTDNVAKLFRHVSEAGINMFASVRFPEMSSRNKEILSMLQMNGCVGIILETRKDDSPTSLCNWDVVKEAKVLTSLPVLAHASLSSAEDVHSFLHYTGADAVVATQELLYRPDLFAPQQHPLNALTMCQQYMQLFREHQTLPSFARCHLLHLLHILLLHCAQAIEDLHTANTCAAFEAVLEEISKSLTSHQGAIMNCYLRPSLAHSDGHHAAQKRWIGDKDQAIVAREWLSSLESLHLLPKEHFALFQQMQFDPSSGTARKLNRLARRKDCSYESFCFGASPIQDFQSAIDNKSQRKKKSKQAEKEERRSRVLQAMSSPDAVCIAVDMGLGDCMSRKELIKLSDQVRRLYGANLSAPSPCHVYLTDMHSESTILKLCRRRNVGFEDYLLTLSEKTHLEIFPKDQLVFLTPDSPNVLVDVLPSKVYVLGGLVDEQIKKNLTLNRAVEASVTTARLPIPEFSNAGATRYAPVLSINQVFEALLTVANNSDWGAALQVAVPARKGFELYDAVTISAKRQELQKYAVDGLVSSRHINLIMTDTVDHHHHACENQCITDESVTFKTLGDGNVGVV
eukprot:gene6954-7609_t